MAAQLLAVRPTTTSGMRKWFNNPEHTILKDEKIGAIDSRKYPKNLIDTTTVTMAWALSFPRVKQAYLSIFGSMGIFKSIPPKYEIPAALRQLILRLARADKFGIHPQVFGELSSSALEINETSQFQIHEVSDRSSYASAWINDTVNSDPELDELFPAEAARNCMQLK